MFSLQCLHTGKITTIVFCRQSGVLLCDPCNGLISITVEVLDLMCSKQTLLSLQGQLLQSLPCLVQVLSTKHNHEHQNTLAICSMAKRTQFNERKWKTSSQLEWR